MPNNQMDHSSRFPSSAHLTLHWNPLPQHSNATTKSTGDTGQIYIIHIYSRTDFQSSPVWREKVGLGVEEF